MTALQSPLRRVVVAMSLSLAAGLCTGVLLHPTAQAQSSDAAPTGSSCRESACVTFIGCTNYGGSDTWGTSDLVWQEVTVIPTTASGSSATRGKLVWQEAADEYQPFAFRAYWKSGIGTGTVYEDVLIDSDGTDSNAGNHTNIRYHSSTVTLCDGYGSSANGDVAYQRTGTHNGNTCIEAVVYSFDVRRYYNGHFPGWTMGDSVGQCWVGSHGWARSENASLEAVAPSDCGDAVTPWTYGSQLNQNLYCYTNTYAVRYTAP